MNYPIFTLAALNGNTLHVRGYVGTAPGQTAYAGSTIEVFKADNAPANQNGHIISGDSANVAHGETSSARLGALFTTDANGMFDAVLTVSGLSITDMITATATKSNNTSEFAANAALSSGATTVSGSIYVDADHSGTNNSGSENWSSSSGTGTVYVNLVQGGMVVASSAIAVATSGAFTFADVPAGSYTLLVGSSATATTMTVPATYIAVQPNSPSVNLTVVANTPNTNNNFGFYKGHAIYQGTVFVDNGTGGGTANNGVKDGGELPLAGVTVTAQSAVSGTPTVYDTAVTDAAGKFSLYIPYSVGTAKVYIVRGATPAGYQATGGTLGTVSTAGGVYVRSPENINLNPTTTATQYTGMYFGEVPVNTLVYTAGNTGALGAAQNSTVYYAHLFTAGTAGTVTITAANSAGWPSEIVYYDTTNPSTCSGTFSANFATMTANMAVTAGKTLCLLVKETVPAAATGANTVTLSETFTYTNAPTPALTATLTQTDVTTVVWKLTGTVYNDVNHNGALDAGETGTNATIYVKAFLNASGTPTISTVDPATGAYSVNVTSSGTYSLILSTNNNATTSQTPSYPAGWIPISPNAGTVTGAATGSVNNFGLYNGSSVSGNVFADTGAGTAANNGVKDTGEAALSGVTVTATNGATSYGSVTTPADGSYQFYLPASATSVTITRTATTGYLATGGSVGNSGGTYSRSSEIVVFAPAAGTVYTGVSFGDVPINTLSNDDGTMIVQGGSAYYPHTFVAGSAGTVTFSTSASSSPSLSWVEAIYIDSNCNQRLDAGEPLATPRGPCRARPSPTRSCLQTQANFRQTTL